MENPRKEHKKTPRGVVISGAYGMDNAGDDAILHAIIASLRRIEQDIPITVIARRPKKTARRFHVAARGLLNVPGWLWAMGRARLFISGGGSLLQDVTSARSLGFYLLTIRLAKRMGCAVQLYGCGIGPVNDEKARRRVRECLNQCADVITVRDGDSLETLKALGVDKPRILLGADPALAAPASSGSRKQQIGFALRPWPGFWVHVPDFAQAARYAWRRYNLMPVFCRLAPEDKTAVDSVLAELNDVPYGVLPQGMRLERMNVTVAMRLHGLVFALGSGTPAAGVSYDPKVETFCREAGLPVIGLGDADGESLCRLIDQALDLDREALDRSLLELRQREQVNSRAAAELLAGAEG